MKRPLGKINILIFIILIIIAVVSILFFSKYYLENQKQNNYQATLEPFYTTSSSILTGKPGQIIKNEKMNLDVPNLANAYRILYISELANGKSAVSSGMVFIPKGKAPPRGRTVLAWAHGTVGMGDACAPSRSVKPLNDMDWLSGALARGWVVSATDYVGLGTSGTPAYLIGASEAHDVLNSVRAVQNMEEANAGNRFVLFGHSQGGHSVLFSAKLAESYASELKLIAAAAAAPAAELVPLFSEEYDESVAWGLGPETSVSWPIEYPDLRLSEVLSRVALGSYRSLSQTCLNGNIDKIKVHILLGQKFYKINPMEISSWRDAATKQTAPILSSQIPLIIAQGLSDEVVIPNTTALYAKKACENGSNLTMMWMNGVGHVPVANIAGSSIISWFEERLSGVPVASTCNQPMPIKPSEILP